MSLYSEPTFRPFDPDGDLRIYWRNLPHWRQLGATYFVTFRLDDSIPQRVLSTWQAERQQWLRQHGIDANADRVTFRNAYQQIPSGVRRIFERRASRHLHEELDKCHGICVIRHDRPRKIVGDAMLHFHAARLWMGDFVIMPNHVHALLIPFAGEGHELEDVLASIKKWTSREMGAWSRENLPNVQRTGPVHNRPRLWQQESYDRLIRDREELAIFRRYILRNPEAAKLAEGEYYYHRADWLDEFAGCQ